MEICTFRQSTSLNATPQQVYEVLMDSKKHSALTGSPAKISLKVGGLVSVYGGYAQGVNIELIPGQRIVQSWRAQENGWPEDHFSEVVFDLIPLGKKRCQIRFAHKRIPEALAENFKKGWKDFYWNPLKRKFGT